jgi:superfamily II DNA or RNA helicase
MGVSRREARGPGQPDLFSVLVADENSGRLGSYSWPDPSRFPLNRPGSTVRGVVWPDLVGSSKPLVVAGYSSIGQLIDLLADWADGRRATGSRIRLLLGSEPFAARRTSFASPARKFTDEVRRHWYERGLSLDRSAQIVAAREAVLSGSASVRAIVGSPALHAKLFIGDRASTIGSSNFTMTGLQRQIEANARFDVEEDPDRHQELRQTGENLWDAGEDWEQAFLDLLDSLLQVVTWQEALGRACGELLDGDWLGAEGRPPTALELWPSQVVGIAQAMWIIERVGSVLVADATGSGKTRMGAHLVRAVRDRLLTTGRMRNQLTVLVCPPSVEETWQREALASGLSINTVSHGLLSRASPGGERIEGAQVHQAQLLAVDEAHNFLNAGSERTKRLRDNAADHVLLFTATPISRGATDLLDLVALLGPDNFDDRTHATLRRLEGNRRAIDVLTETEIDQLRTEIQRFMLRRTKTHINRMVDADPESYRHPTTDRVCRYPAHDPEVYGTGETEQDVAAATAIRELAAQLNGIAQLPMQLKVPAGLRERVSDEAWLRFQLRSTAGLSAHHVLAALRSSRAALYEHLHGTEAAVTAFGLSRSPKAVGTGNVCAKLEDLAAMGPPDVELDAALPDWLTNTPAWGERCLQELKRYEAVGDALSRISGTREEAKASLLAELNGRHDRVLAFDRHPTTLVAIHDLLVTLGGADVRIATGRSQSERRKVQRLFAPETETDQPVIALCSDAMSEGLNLQGASAMVHLDLPTTLRVAEQRVGRVDRMDSRHDRIEAWWPRDGDAFATRANERLAGRVEESRTLLGANLSVPNLGALDLTDAEVATNDDIIDPVAVHHDVEQALAGATDQLVDALEPVRALVEGPDSVVPADVYARTRSLTARVVARVAPVSSPTTWAFLAVRSPGRGVPRWIWVEPDAVDPCETDLGMVVDRLRSRLDPDPPNRFLDTAASEHLRRCLDLAAQHELELLPRRSQRALAQMAELAQTWAKSARKEGDEHVGQRWVQLADLARPQTTEVHPDPFTVAERWLELVAPRLEEHRKQTKGRRYSLLKDITPGLRNEPLRLEEVEEQMTGLAMAPPLAERVSVCVLGLPGNASGR